MGCGAGPGGALDDQHGVAEVAQLTLTFFMRGLEGEGGFAGAGGSGEDDELVLGDTQGVFLRLWRRAVEHDVVGHRRTSSLSGPAAARLGRSISARVRPLGSHPGIFEVTRAMPNGRVRSSTARHHSQRKPHRLAPYRRTRDFVIRSPPSAARSMCARDSVRRWGLTSASVTADVLLRGPGSWLRAAFLKRLAIQPGSRRRDGGRRGSPSARQAQRRGVAGRLFVADDEHVGHLLELRVADLACHAARAGRRPRRAVRARASSWRRRARA